jgi:hypothetical protein
VPITDIQPLKPGARWAATGASIFGQFSKSRMTHGGSYNC